MSYGIFPLDDDFLSSDLDPLSEPNTWFQHSSSSSFSQLSSSPPSHQMQDLCLSPSTAYNVPSSMNVVNLDIETKSEGFEEGFIQRSLSSQSLDQKPSFLFHPHFSSVALNHSYENGALGGGPMRRVCSTSDLHTQKRVQCSEGSPASPLANHITVPEEAGLANHITVGRRYSSEERKERIHRYRSKRNQRNFGKTIKYACRKTLADSRPRVRGRFAKNDEASGEVPKCDGNNKEEEDELQIWVGRFLEEEEIDGQQLW